MPPREEHHIHPKYRPDIDGLRAIAVLAVVGFHAFPRWMPGGFIGVDIFFVISGYLISTIIFGSLAGTGFSYREFYGRRIRRIFPALLTVLVPTLLFGWYVLLSDEFRQLGKHVLASAGFVVNLVLWNESGYFDTVAESKPLLHLWSLAVEEQFYILWPLLLGLAWRLGGNKGHRLGVWMWVVVVLSFLLNVAAVHRHPTATFYSPLPRMWELAAGALLAWSALRREPHRNVFRRELRSVGGLVLLALGLLLIQKGKAFPGWWALLPVVGTCLCISAGPGAWLNRHLLAMRPMVWVGLISYPLYLWHWPILAFARIVEGGEPVRNVRIGAVVASVLMAWLTYRFVERKLRRREGPGVVRGLVLGMAVLGIVGGLLWWQKVSPRHSDPNLQAIAAAGTDWAYPDGMRSVRINGQDFFTVGRGNRHVVLVGDSHVEQYGPRVVELANAVPDKLGTLVFATRGACPPIPFLREDRDPVCGERLDAALQYALTPEVQAVVIGGCWSCYFDVGEVQPGASAPPAPDHYYFFDGLKRHPLRGGDGVDRSLEALGLLMQTLRATGKDVYLLLNIPVGETFEPHALITGERLGTMTAVRGEPYTALPPSQKRLHDRLREIALANGATPIDPLPALCSADGQCLRSDDRGVPIYKDGAHLRAAYVRRSASYLDAALLDRP